MWEFGPTSPDPGQRIRDEEQTLKHQAVERQLANERTRIIHDGSGPPPERPFADDDEPALSDAGMAYRERDRTAGGQLGLFF